MGETTFPLQALDASAGAGKPKRRAFLTAKKKAASHMMPEGTDLLKRVIETQHGGVATFRDSVRVLNLARCADWDGIVHVFDVAQHSSKRAYAWSLQVQGRPGLRCFAVLHGGRVTGPHEAVKAAARAIEQARVTRRAQGATVTSGGRGLWV